MSKITNHQGALKPIDCSNQLITMVSRLAPKMSESLENSLSSPDDFNYETANNDHNIGVKIICLGDSAVGKSKLVERYLLNDFRPQQLSTYALTLYKHQTKINDRNVSVDFWDTAGQERFQSMHASYYHQAHACIFVFDVTRKITYKNLTKWYEELRQNRPEIPCICIANKIDGRLCNELLCAPPLYLTADMSMTTKSFNFAKKNRMAFYFASASDGTNVVRAFKDAIRAAVAYKETSTDIMDQIIEELERMELEQPEELVGDPNT